MLLDYVIGRSSSFIDTIWLAADTMPSATKPYCIYLHHPDK